MCSKWLKNIQTKEILTTIIMATYNTRNLYSCLVIIVKLIIINRYISLDTIIMDKT